MEPKDVLQELLDLETAGWDALCDGTASDFYGRLMHDDALMVMANGMVLDRPGVVDTLRQSPPWDSYAIDDPRGSWPAPMPRCSSTPAPRIATVPIRSSR